MATRIYVTFGVQHRDEPHPTLPQHWANPDGYGIIEAPNKHLAYRILQALTFVNDNEPLAYAFDYLEPPAAKYCPDGASFKITYQDSEWPLHEEDRS